MNSTKYISKLIKSSYLTSLKGQKSIKFNLINQPKYQISNENKSAQNKSNLNDSNDKSKNFNNNKKANSNSQPTKKTNLQFLQKYETLKSMKQYIIPFLHKDQRVTSSLLKSYGYLVFSKFCFFGGPLFLKHAINALQSGANAGISDPLLMFLGYGICYSLSVIFQSLRNVQTVKIVNIALTESATNAYRHMLSLGPEFFFSGSQRHKLFNLYKAQIATQQNLKSFTQYFIPIAIDISLSAVMLFYYSGSPFVVSFITCYAFYSVFTIKYSDFRKEIIKKLRLSEKQLDFITSETFANYYNVKYFMKEEQQLDKYKKGLENYYSRTTEQQRTLGVLNSVQRVIFGAGLTFNLILAAYYTQKGILSTGDIIMIQALMMQFLNPLFFLGTMYRSFSDTFVDVKELRDTLRLPVRVNQGNQILQNIRGNIRFNNVSFKYLDQGNQIMQKINFEIKQNSFVAIIGESGSGKTTLLNLIFRLYDPISGSIQIDGKNIKDLKFSFRKSISFVSQSPYLFNGTVLDNLKFGYPQANFDQIIELAKKFNVHQTIMKLPNGYNSEVGQKGNIFSGGQKQRISLIRALLKKSKIILLDEPTSSLDLQTQKKIAEVLSEYKDCTRVMITHRDALLKYCDNVITIKKAKKQNNEALDKEQ